jgi:type IV pilus assembly protein PilB
MASKRPKGLTDEQYVRWLSRQYGVPAIALDDFEIDREVLALLPAELAEEKQVLPVARDERHVLVLAMSDPSSVATIDDVKTRTGLNVEVVVAPEGDLRRAVRRYYFAN